ncbi:tyrosine-protein phosphatase non-receptor type substrate 1-like [Astyanax mexicanus]|uniref:tyrosine-protein phosphatase non-receptor type substrate 1-like n=1 Tax=Astyanax mexicanus TaxID=7994 RepID=UPI0020CAF43C|nr:tyrosine-protein phosphatase non-receptor type substrate 1-like [Astyanax mexicanus]
MITVIAALCLFTTVKTDITGLQVQTVKIGNNVTIKCDQITDNNKDNIDLNVAWYKESLGNVPKLIVRLMGSKQHIRFASGVAEGRLKFDKDTFDLSIYETVEEDAALYYCGKISKSGVVEFESGTRLIVEAEKTDGYPPTKVVIKSGDSATLQCSVQSLNCSEDHSVYWFRHGSGESDPGIIFTHGDSSSPCTRSSETVSPTQSCIYKLPKNNLSLSDAGTYYCAVAACGHIFFGNGTKLNVVGSATDYTVKVNQVASNEALKGGFTIKQAQMNKDPEMYSHVIYTNKTH